MAFAALALLPRLAFGEDWSTADTSDEQESDHAFDRRDFDAAETLSRGVLDRHPDSVTALLYHIKDLEGMDKLQQARTETQKALEIDPKDASANEWLGLILVRLGRGAEAIPYLNASIAQNAEEPTSSIWLALAEEQAGRTADAKQVLDSLLANMDDKLKGDFEQKIADAYHRAENPAAALKWWRESAAHGNPYAAEWLAWAYSNNYGGPGDSGDVAYWQRRAIPPSFPWFHRLPFADEVVGWANGWGLVLIALASAVILPLLTINVAAFLCSRGLTTDPYVHWTERARISYPFQVLLSGAVIFLPLVHLTTTFSYPASLLPIPKSLLLLAAFVVTLLTSNVVVTYWTRRYRSDVGTPLQNLQDLGVTIYIYLSTLILMGTIASFLPSQWNVQAVLVILAIVLAFLWFNFGGWLQFGRLLGIFHPADAELRVLVANLAQRLGQPTPTSWIVNWRKANAYAVVLSNAVCVTRKLRDILSPAEMEAVLAHEMAHISEDQTTRAIRLVLPLVMFMPLFTFGLWDQDGSPYGLLIAFSFPLLGVTIHQRLARRMEVRADDMAQKAESAPGVYPAALAKLYEANLMPAVMTGKRKIHPHLYDRFLAAGLTPDFPRPQPPRRWDLLAALAVAALNYALLTALWLALF